MGGPPVPVLAPGGVAGSGGSVSPAAFCGVGVPAANSVELLSLSTAKFVRVNDFVLSVTPVAAAVSNVLDVPNPIRSRTAGLLVTDPVASVNAEVVFASHIVP